ncbi:hypothetical protein HYH03_009482 [Edaphochlamys debaryana]|uniref:Uncharacterized protein n=1 Tax=Edaphochlamys debaryana TaxID=47281 RepID=A0A836BYF3_9CHLO|nr:hypothetical protein HYH03_009482 [Edaphochlamys debaryana]|eukprot:KAG2492238.1 hypothetical protein HYH03_009482 [Edaphochlamys debaryana]
MPPKGKARGVGPSASSSGAAASNSPSLLPSGLTAAFAALGMSGPSLMCTLSTLEDALIELPSNSRRHAAALAELLSTHPDSAKALLRLHAAALREGAGAEGAAAGGGSGGSVSGASALAGPAGADLRDLLSRFTLDLIYHCTPLPASRHTLTVLRFVRAMLRSQPLHVLSRRLAAAAAALEGRAGGGGGANAADGEAEVEQGRKCMDKFTFLSDSVAMLLWDIVFAGLLFPKEGAPTHINPPPELAAEVASERAAGVEKLARGLAESCVLEHAARVLLLLQARGPQAVRPREGANQTLPEDFVSVLRLWFATAQGGDRRLIVFDPLSNPACPPCVSPAASAHISSALSGRCVQTAVLVYGVGTLRLVDRGPTYGLPAALQTAGLAMCEVGQRSPGPLILDLLLRQLASRGALPPPGPGASLELALRVGRAAVGTLAAQHPSSTAQRDPNDAMAIFKHPPKVVLPLHTDPKDSTLLLAAAALRCSRGLLSAQDATPQQVERRGEWWRLAAGALVHGVHDLDSESLERLLDLVTEPLLKGGQGRSGVDVVSPELAAALESGLLSVLAMLFLSAMRFQRRSGHFTQQIFAACDRAASRDDGLGFALLVTPLLAYGSTGQSILLLDMLGMHGGLPVGRKARPQSDGLQDPDFVRIAARVAKPNQRAVRQVAASLLSYAGSVLEEYETQPAGAPPPAEAPAGQAEAGAAAAGPSASAPAAASAADAAASAAAAAPDAAAMSPGEQLRGLLAYASELWGLPLPPPLASGR